jgi:hypothetical protein
MATRPDSLVRLNHLKRAHRRFRRWLVLSLAQCDKNMRRAAYQTKREQAAAAGMLVSNLLNKFDQLTKDAIAQPSPDERRTP